MKANKLKRWLIATLVAGAGSLAAIAGETFAWDEKAFELMPSAEEFAWDEKTFELMPAAEEFAWDEKTFYLMPDPDEGGKQSDIEEAFGPNVDVKPMVDDDGNVTNYLVTVTNDINNGAITLPDNLGPIVIDLNGRTIVGTNGVDGTETTAGGDGGAAIEIVHVDGDGEPTVITIVDSKPDADPDIIGGNGGNGNPAGNGGAAIKVADDARDGVKINVGEDVDIVGGNGGDGQGYSAMGVQLWKDGPYFAECNVGATKPEESGYFFWWGDTVGYKRNAANNGWVSSKDGSAFLFSTSTCRTWGRSNAELVSMGFTDASGNLVSGHDAATAHMGGSWRMPTGNEINGLVDNTIRTWTNFNGVAGYLVAGKGDYAGNSIFLPEYGYGANSEYKSASTVGYHSATVSTGDTCVSLDFNNGKFVLDTNGRSSGCMIRPVSDIKPTCDGGNGGAGVDGEVGTNDGDISGGQGGQGGSSTSGEGGQGGNGGAGVDGDVDHNGETGTITGGEGGQGGSSTSGKGGDGGQGGAGVNGDVGTNDGDIAGGQGGQGGSTETGTGGNGGNGGAAIDPATTGGDEPAGDGTETGGNGGNGGDATGEGGQGGNGGDGGQGQDQGGTGGNGGDAPEGTGGNGGTGGDAPEGTGGNGGTGGDGVVPGEGGAGGDGVVPGTSGGNGSASSVADAVESIVITDFVNDGDKVRIAVKITFKEGVNASDVWSSVTDELVVIRAETVDGFVKGEITKPEYTIVGSDQTAKTVTVEVTKPTGKTCGFYKVAFEVVGE